MTWYVYEVSPIDHEWWGLAKVSAVAETLAGRDARFLVEHGSVSGIDGVTSDEFMDLWNSAREAAAGAGWEGDFRIPPVVMWLPTENQFRPGFVIKQDNNGSTYVISPVPLPHLED